MMPAQTEIVPLRKEIVDCLSQQLSEYDLLKSMYPNHGEIILSNKGNLEEFNKFLDGDSEYVPNNLEFVINLFIDNLKLEICVNLPVTYPNEKPDIYIRCNQLNRLQESNLNTELALYINTNHIGEVCLYTAITWLQDNIDTISNKNQEVKIVENSATVECSSEAERFTRFWIYSHHIYNKKKREEITKRSKELNLTGFCLPGKPGVICIEGDESACKEWWQNIKSMTWKKIVIRKTETFHSSEKSNCRRFSNFEEIHFQTLTRTNHANMSEFSKFMSKHGFSDIFSEFFGFNE